ncbi:hypothetical protein M7I_7302 [Glarea lozoyensis 74030]|uniref:Uncharacterized protein n=1 Tax=Glarea lozoyensis (strain ATCC 74030 / MF5533) TaxID=1104152 RepID=H0EWX7_GLAL7|nr:hypothetical protein M7I_7302 [Glarea lozoyensis 74030]
MAAPELSMQFSIVCGVHVSLLYSSTLKKTQTDL